MSERSPIGGGGRGGGGGRIIIIMGNNCDSNQSDRRKRGIVRNCFACIERETGILVLILSLHLLELLGKGP